MTAKQFVTATSQYIHTGHNTTMIPKYHNASQFQQTKRGTESAEDTGNESQKCTHVVCQDVRLRSIRGHTHREGCYEAVACVSSVDGAHNVQAASPWHNRRGALGSQKILVRRCTCADNLQSLEWRENRTTEVAAAALSTQNRQPLATK